MGLKTDDPIIVTAGLDVMDKKPVETHTTLGLGEHRGCSGTLV